jgi:glucose 1-dehydrogenase
MAIGFAQAGADVLVNYHIDEEGARQTAKAIEACGRKAEVFQADVASEDDVSAMFHRMTDAFGRIDICAPNSGIQLNARVDEMTLAQWQRVIDVNLTGMFLCAREAIRAFKKQGIDRSVSYAMGKLIFMSSVHDIIPWEGHANYAAAKGGIMLLMKSLAQEVAHLRIRVNALSPGAIRTPMNVEKLTSPEVFERVLLKLIPGVGRIRLRERRHHLHRRRHDSLSRFHRRRIIGAAIPWLTGSGALGYDAATGWPVGAA